jgi:hypothetical protein
VAGFESPKIGSGTQQVYVIMAIWLPLAITGISIVGVMLTTGLRPREEPPNNALVGTSLK